MNFTKLTRTTNESPSAGTKRIKMIFDTLMFFLRPDIQGKSCAYYLKRIDHNIIERPWLDLESAQKFVEFHKDLCQKYNIELINYEILDIDKSYY